MFVKLSTFLESCNLHQSMSVWLVGLIAVTGGVLCGLRGACEP